MAPNVKEAKKGDEIAPQPFLDNKDAVGLDVTSQIPAYSFYLSLIFAIPYALSYLLSEDSPYLSWCSWGVPLIAYVVVPIVDKFLPVDRLNPSHLTTTSAREEAGLGDIKYRVPLWIWVPLQLFFVLHACWHTSVYGNISFGIGLGRLVSLGIIGGVMFNISHELTHKTNIEKWIGHVPLLLCYYLHFAIEHPKGHHANVCTPRDGASARYNETLWQFLPRTVVRSYQSAWAIECRRLAILGYGKWSLNNQMIWYAVLSAAVPALMWNYWGFSAAVWFLLQGAITVLKFEGINYIEHYGLSRKELATGLGDSGKQVKYEPQSYEHAWNANTWMGNSVLFKLQRHSDHHTHPLKEYQTLIANSSWPQYPDGYGYAVMYWVAWYPSLWFKWMNPRVEWVHKHVYKRPIPDAAYIARGEEWGQIQEAQWCAGKTKAS